MNVSFGSRARLSARLSRGPLSDPQADHGESSKERPFVADRCLCSGTLSIGCFGSGSDYRLRHPERPHLGVERTKTGESGPLAADLPLSGVLLSWPVASLIVSW